MESVIIKAPEAGAEDPAHIAAMIAKADGVAPAETPPVESGERPAWLPEKFKSAEEMAKAYGELETKLGAVKPSAPVTPADPAVSPTTGLEIQAQEALESKGLDLADFSKEFGDTGSLSAESYTKLADAGYPKNFVDDYIAGQTARSELFVSTLKNSIGGDESFSAMSDWAKVSLSPAELTVYNNAIDSSNPEQSKLAVLGLYQKFTTARPVEPQLLGGGAGGAADAYESNAQVKADMRSDLYKSDPAFRAKVAAKIGRSPNVL